jgi:hypothetical protein
MVILKKAAATASLLSLAGLLPTAWGDDSPSEKDSYILRGVFPFADSENMNSISMNGDTPSTFAFGNVARHWVRMSTFTEDGAVAVAQELTSDTTGSTDFGRTVDLFGTAQMGNHLAIGDSELAYYYTGGDWNTWSVQQVFEPPSDYPTGGEFGKHAYFNHIGYNEMVIPCPSCGVENIGRIYVYEQEKGPKHTWTQSAMLEAAQKISVFACTTPADNSIFLGSGNVKISGPNILATTEYTHCSQGGSILFSKRHGQWSQQQTFWSAVTPYSTMAIEADTIAIGAAGASYGTHADVGAVHIQYPNTVAFGAKPEPGAPTQWSLHQILYPPDPQDNLYFGSDISIHGDRLYIGSPATTEEANKLYYYERPSMNGYWSLQQSLSPPAGTKTMSVHDVFGSTIVALPTTDAPLTVAAVYESRYEWDCLIISLEDQFGDGWDTAKLQILSPGQEPTFYSPHCNAPNPFEFRYCPRYSTSDYQGLHKLSIVDGPKSKFFWEIQWRVYEESTGNWYRGNHATRMDFHFDSSKKTMTRRGIFHDLPANITCVSCPAKPEEKSKPKLGPVRKLKDETHAPSVSPAPTLGQTVMTGDAWRYLVLSTSGEPWFDNRHQGTNYYISDSQGHRLISTGTSCLDTPSLCYQVFPDGQYVLRVSGGLNEFGGDHSWEFCGRRGGAGEQLDFVVKNGKCDAIVSYTSGTYCSTVLHSFVQVLVELEMFGISETTSMEQLVDADFEALATTLATLVGHGLSPSDIKLAGITNQFGHAVFEVSIHADAVQFGADPHDLDSMETVVSKIATIFSNAASTGQLHTALTSTTVAGALFFQNLQDVHFISSTMTSIDAVAATESNARVTDVVQTEVAAEPTETASNNNLYYYVVAGYAVSIFALIGLVAYTYKQIRSTVATSAPVPTAEMNSDSTHKTPSPTTTTAAAPANPKTTKQHPSVDSTQKSQQMNTIMIADLIQMVKEVSSLLLSLSSSLTFPVSAYRRRMSNSKRQCQVIISECRVHPRICPAAVFL